MHDAQKNYIISKLKHEKKKIQSYSSGMPRCESKIRTNAISLLVFSNIKT